MIRMDVALAAEKSQMLLLMSKLHISSSFLSFSGDTTTPHSGLYHRARTILQGNLSVEVEETAATLRGNPDEIEVLQNIRSWPGFRCSRKCLGHFQRNGNTFDAGGGASCQIRYAVLCC